MQIPSPERMLTALSQHAGLAELLHRLAGRGSVGPRLLAVGGAVRDTLLGRDSIDVDILVEGPVEAALGLFDTAQRAHDRFGTVTAVLAGRRFDLAQARTEHYAHPGALPEVKPASAEQDLARRDFTVNALAVELTGPDRGRLLAHPSALSDLERRHLAVLHRRSFSDDPTRLMRLARYRARLGFEVEPGTRELARAAVDGGALDTVSGNRIGNELRLLAREPDPVAALGAMAEIGLDRAIDPRFGIGAAGGELAEATRAALSVLPSDGRRDLVALAAAALEIPQGSLRSLLDRLAFGATERGVIEDAVSGTPRLVKALPRAERPSEIAAAIGSAPPEAVALAAALADPTGHRNAARWLGELRLARTDITGDDLVALGIPPGPAIGAGLAAARAALLDGEAPERERQLQVALAAARR